jgi:hypothetical protein
MGTKDMVVLTADKGQLFAIRTLLDRHRDLGTRSFTFDCYAHPRHDSGILREAHNFLRVFHRDFSYALVVCDLDGCGQERLGREGVERKINENLAVNGWQNRCEAVAIEPELECWVWDASLRIARLLK